MATSPFRISPNIAEYMRHPMKLQNYLHMTTVYIRYTIFDDLLKWLFSWVFLCFFKYTRILLLYGFYDVCDNERCIICLYLPVMSRAHVKQKDIRIGHRF